MKKFFFIVLQICNVFLAVAQEDPQISQYMFNQMTVNPGYTGSEDGICASAWDREDYVGVPGAKNVTVLGVSSSVKPFGISSGVGINVANDRIGFNNDKSANISYAYRMDLGSGKLGIGINAGVINNAIDPTWRTISSDGSSILNGKGNDPSIPDKENIYALDVSAGLFYKTEDLYLGLSCTHLNKPKLTYQGTSVNPSYVNRHFYLMSGYTIQLPNPALQLIPSFCVHTDTKVAQVTLNTNLLYNKRFWGGISFRPGDAVVGIVGLELLNGIRLGYSYDFVISDISKTTSGGHEFMVSYCFKINKEKIPQRYKSIRFL